MLCLVKLKKLEIRANSFRPGLLCTYILSNAELRQDIHRQCTRYFEKAYYVKFVLHCADFSVLFILLLVQKVQC